MKTAITLLAIAAALTGTAAMAAEPAREGASAPAHSQAQMTLTIPSMPIGSALNEFGRQSGLHIVMDAKLARGLMSRAVDGTYTVETALKRLLGETGLQFEYLDAKTVTIRSSAPGRITSSSPSAAVSATGEHSTTIAATLQPAATETSALPAAAARTEDVQTEVVVTGSHITGTAASAAQPVFSLTREDIENTGVTSLGDLFRYIPQVTDVSTGEEQADTVNTFGGGMFGPVVTGLPIVGLNSNRVSASLRGAPAGGTLILVNGRRVPRNGNQDGQDSYDVSGVPVGAIERIDVVPAGASSIYGADALGGVINIILRKSGSGTQVQLSHESTFDTDAGVSTGELSHFFSAGRFSGRLSGTWQQSNALALRDRDFAASLDRRPYGGQDFRGDPTDSFTPAGGSGKIYTYGPPLPGSTLPYAPIPAGSNGQSTIADYLAAGSTLEPYDVAQYMDYNAPYERHSASGSVQYDFASWLSVSLDARWSENRMSLRQQPIEVNLSLPVGVPGNPFDVPVNLDKMFFDLEPGHSIARGNTGAAVLGLAGDLPRRWNYHAGVAATRSHNRSYTTAGEDVDYFLGTAALAGPNPPILAYDSTTVDSPNAPGTIEALTTVVGTREEEVMEWVYDATVSGPVASWTPGDIRVAAGAEYRDEDVDYPINPLLVAYTPVARDTNTASFFLEAQVPIVGGAWSRPGARELMFTTSARRDRYTGYSGKTVFSYGLFYRPFGRLSLRGNWAEGFKVPTLQQRYEPARTGNAYFNPVFQLVPDPLRGGTPLSGLIPTLGGGNPGLRPERSRTTSVGAALRMPAIEGLELTVDYFRNDYVDRIGNLDTATLLMAFPDKVTRGPRLPGDPAGWEGPITQFDARPLNTAFNRIAGWDLGFNYDTRIVGGSLTTRASMTRTTANELRTIEDGPLLASVNTHQLPTKISGSLFYARSGWNAGVLCVYEGRKQYVLGQPFTGAATRWDAQVRYDFAARGGATYWLLRDTRVGLTVFNVLNTRPPFNFNYLPDNGVLDTRMRRYSLSLVREF